MLSHFSHVWLCVTLWTVACQAPVYMGFTRQEYCSGLPFPTPGDLPDPRIKPMSPAFGGMFFNNSATQEAPFLMDKPFYFEDIMCAKFLQLDVIWVVLRLLSIMSSSNLNATFFKKLFLKETNSLPNILYISFSLLHVITYWSLANVRGVCNLLSSVSSQQKFEAMDQCYSLQRDQCYSSVLFRKERKILPRGMRAYQPKRREEKRGTQCNFGSSFYMVFLFPLGLPYVYLAHQECCWFYWGPHSGGRTFLCSIFAFPFLVF